MIANDNDFVFAIFIRSKEEDNVCAGMFYIFLWVESIIANRNIDNTLLFSTKYIKDIFRIIPGKWNEYM